jgi:hypothetical protein
MTIPTASARLSPRRRRLAQRAAPLLLCLPLAGCGMLPARLSLPWSDPAPTVAPPAQVRTAPAGTGPAVDWNGNPIAPPRPPAAASSGMPAPTADAGQSALDAALAPVPGDARNAAPGSSALGEDAVAARQFRQLDANGDGFLDADEVAGLPRLREALAAADADGDGRLSFEELRRFALVQRAVRAGADEASPPAATSGAQQAPAAARVAPPSSGGIGLRPSTGR